MSTGQTPKPPRSNSPRSASPRVVKSEARVVETTTVNAHSGPLNTMALVGFIMSMVGIVFTVTAIPGVILSHIGLKQIKATGEPGHGFALAGIIVGYCVIGITALAVIVLIVTSIIMLFVFGGLLWASGASY